MSAQAPPREPVAWDGGPVLPPPRPPRRGLRGVLRSTALRVVGALLLLAALALPVAGWLLTRDPGPVTPQEAAPGVREAYVSDLAKQYAPPAPRGKPTVRVLTYHGVDDSGSDYQVSFERFAEQMAALRAAGYRTISGEAFARFLRGDRVRLPRHPLLITFDDGIKSVWTRADPVLARNGFRATVMTITGRVSRNQPYYLTWEETARLKATGRWDFAAHTHDGHRRVAIDPRGGEGAFLTHRAWKPGARRLETLAEYRRRVRADLEASQRELRERGLGATRTFAFPFSTYELPTNDPRVPPILRREVFRRFDVALDNERRASRLPAEPGRRYLPRYELLRGTSTATLLRDLARAPALPRQLAPPGRESVYPFLDAGEREVADLLLQDRWKLDRYDPVRIAGPRWDEDPYDEQYWRFNFYGLRPLNDLLWAHRTLGDPRYLAKLEQILRSYVAHDDARLDRRRSGLNRRTWDYKYGAAFRALTLVSIEAKLRRSDDLDRELGAGLRRSIRRLGSFLAEPRNFDVGNNHGFAEATALLLIAVNHPRLPESQGWRRVADRRLVDLIARNVDAGGVQVERSPFYHFYVLRLASDLTVWARRHDVRLPAEFSRRAESMLRFATWITQPDGQIPLQGSSVRTDVRKLAPETFAALGDRDPGFAWMRSGGLAGRAPQGRTAAFRASGDAILRSDWGGALDAAAPSMIAFNAGRHRTTHAQHDALSFVLYGAGRPLLTDSGLFTYDRGRWKRYFSSTRAHNTITLDGADQRRGPVRMGLVTEGPGWSYASGSHRLHRGASVRRSVVLLGRTHALVIDDVASRRRARIAQNWHLFPGATLERRGRSDDVFATSSGKPLLALWQDAPAGTMLTDHFGDERPLQGWHSELYGKRRKNHALEYAVVGRRARFATLIAIGPAAGRADSRVELGEVQPGVLQARACIGRVSWTVRVRAQAGAGERVSALRGARCSR